MLRCIQLASVPHPDLSVKSDPYPVWPCTLAPGDQVDVPARPHERPLACVCSCHHAEAYA